MYQVVELVEKRLLKIMDSIKKRCLKIEAPLLICSLVKILYPSGVKYDKTEIACFHSCYSILRNAIMTNITHISMNWSITQFLLKVNYHLNYESYRK